MKFRVAQKGLILVGVPLIFELVIFSWMYVLVQQSEVAANKAIYSRRLVGSINEIVVDISSLTTTFSGDSLSGISINRKAYNARLSNLKKNVEVLRSLAHQLPSPRREELLRSMLWFDDLFRKSPDLVNTYQSGGFQPTLLKIRELIRYFEEFLRNDTLRSICALALYENGQTEQQILRESELRQLAQTLLLVGTGVGALLTVILAHFFAKQISDRLTVIKNNNIRFAANQELMLPLSGTDEIADVDKAFRDMTHELTASRLRDEQVQKLRDQILAMVTHDLRTPLQTFSTFLRVLENELTKPNLTKLLDNADRNVTRMEQLVSDLLDLEKLRTNSLQLVLEPFAISEVIFESIEMVTAAAKKKEITLEQSGDSEVLADERRTIQILTNLLSNAIKFSPQNSTVSVVVSEAEHNTSVDVIDHGRGIPPDLVGSVFDAYSQVSAEDASKLGGKGFGLAVCKALVELHGGEISVISTEGGGSTFRFTLPKNHRRNS